MGLNGDPVTDPNNVVEGLIQKGAAVLGTAPTGGATPTKLYLAYRNADYTYTSASTPLGGNDSNLEAIALDKFENWMKLHLAAIMMGAACYKDTNASNFADSDNFGNAAGTTLTNAWCVTTNGV